MLIQYTLIIFSIGVSLLPLVAAEPANEIVVAEFLKCLQSQNTTGYGYNVTDTGELILAPLAKTGNHSSIDRAAWSVCNRRFGLGFHCSLFLGVHTFHPSTVLLDLRDATASGLIERGLLAREPPPDLENLSVGEKLLRVLLVGGSMGFSDNQIQQELGVNDSLWASVLKERDHKCKAMPLMRPHLSQTGRLTRLQETPATCPATYGTVLFHSQAKM